MERTVIIKFAREETVAQEDVKECSCDLTTLTFKESERRPE